VLEPLREELVVLAEAIGRAGLGRELELDPADVAGILAAAVLEILDRHLDQRRGLAACKPL
jgi:hypothetical protein